MADQIISLKIPSTKVAKAIEGFLFLYPNGEKTDDEVPVAKYTDKQWVTEKVRRNIVRDIHRGLNKKARSEAVQSVDDTLVE